MKTLLIATDFSQASRNACLYGIELAKAFNAKVLLFSAYQAPVIPAAVNEGMIVLPPSQTKESILQNLKEEAQAINPDNLVFLEACTKEGVAFRTIIEKA